MLQTTLLHPDILRALARAGHHSRVLIADGNYPAENKRGPRAELVSLQLSPGVPTVLQVFEALLGAVSGLECEILVRAEGQEIRQRSGKGTLRIDPRL